MYQGTQKNVNMLATVMFYYLTDLNLACMTMTAKCPRHLATTTPRQVLKAGVLGFCEGNGEAFIRRIRLCAITLQLSCWSFTSAKSINCIKGT